nr:MAG TPA: hypothetical protein [Caudoviricetes sp.]
MKEKVLELLEQKFAGVRKDGLNLMAGVIAMGVKTEDEAKATVEKITVEQVNAYVQDWRKSADSEITKSNQTYDKTMREKIEKELAEKMKPNPPVPPNPPDPNNIQELIKEAVKQATEGISNELATIKAQSQKEERAKLISDTAKKLGISDVFMKHFHIGENDDVEKVLSEYKQELVTNSLLPKEGNIKSTSDAEMQAEAKAWAESLPSK